MYCINLVDKLIQTFKGHFKSVLCGVDKSFPLNLWDRHIPKIEMQVNILCQSNVSPKVSAYAYLNGPHNFNCVLMAPLGCAIYIYKNPNRSASWEPHSVSVWYLGTSNEHYC